MKERSLIPGVRSVLSLACLRERYARADLFVTDLDGCLLPGYSQTWLGAFVFFRFLLGAAEGENRRFLSSLLGGAAFIAREEMKRPFGRGAGNRAMMDRYEEVMGGIPRRYFEEEARRAARLLYPAARRALLRLSRRAPLGVISLGTDISLRAVAASLRSEEGETVSLIDANELRFGPEEPFPFLGYERENLRTGGADKRRTLEGWMKERAAKTPWIVGHNRDEVEMARLAREAGGVSVALHPGRGIEESYDVVIRPPAWRRFLRLLNLLEA